MISVIIPASNEGKYIEACLLALLASTHPGGAVQVIVAANGCRDDTVEKSRRLQAGFEERGWSLDVLDLPAIGKLEALNGGDAVSRFSARAYIDADIVVTPNLLRELCYVLRRPHPVYVSGTLRIPETPSFVSRRYARFWLKLPFVTDGVPGAGVFAVNAAARSRWEKFPDIISDDTFVRYHFRGEEMVKVEAQYFWPVSVGFKNLVRVRRRQNEGIEEISRLFPHLVDNVPATKPSRMRLLRLLFQDPLGFMIYSGVAVAVRLPVFRNTGRWDRGR